MEKIIKENLKNFRKYATKHGYEEKQLKNNEIMFFNSKAQSNSVKEVDLYHHPSCIELYNAVMKSQPAFTFQPYQ